jgi:cephalosporin hydroxylase
MVTQEWKFLPLVIPIRQAVKRASDIIPSLALNVSPTRRVTLMQEFRRCAKVPESIAFTERHGLSSCQKAYEISAALDLINEIKPQILCEIGTSYGGTSLLFSRFIPSLKLMICLDLYVKNKAKLRLLKPSSLALHFCEASSHSKGMLHSVEKILSDRPIDVLFIDGDHRYEGVKQDFEDYSRLVRPGGIILLHDIVQEKPGGKEWAGGVPQFWREIKDKFEYREIIEDHDQNAYGIGVLATAKPPR